MIHSPVLTRKCIDLCLTFTEPLRPDWSCVRLHACKINRLGPSCEKWASWVVWKKDSGSGHCDRETLTRHNQAWGDPIRKACWLPPCHLAPFTSIQLKGKDEVESAGIIQHIDLYTEVPVYTLVINSLRPACSPPPAWMLGHFLSPDTYQYFSGQI